jgi:hypothetical protein
MDKDGFLTEMSELLAGTWQTYYTWQHLVGKMDEDAA